MHCGAFRRTVVTAQVSKFWPKAGKTAEALLPPGGPRRLVAPMVSASHSCAHQVCLLFPHSCSASSVFLPFLILGPAGGTQG